jgi:hypothetical protein
MAADLTLSNPAELFRRYLETPALRAAQDAWCRQELRALHDGLIVRRRQRMDAIDHAHDGTDGSEDDRSPEPAPQGFDSEDDAIDWNREALLIPSSPSTVSPESTPRSATGTPPGFASPVSRPIASPSAPDPETTAMDSAAKLPPERSATERTRVRRPRTLGARPPSGP